jgi:hypothetical protein
VSEGLGVPDDHYGLGAVAGAVSDMTGGGESPVGFNGGESRAQHFQAGYSAARGQQGSKPPVHPPAGSATPLKVAAYGLNKAFKVA